MQPLSDHHATLLPTNGEEDCVTTQISAAKETKLTDDFLKLKKKHLFLTGSCRRRTTTRYCCSFPFIYRGRRYNSCTKGKHNRPWCAMTPNYDRDKKWGNCASMLFLLMVI